VEEVAADLIPAPKSGPFVPGDPRINRKGSNYASVRVKLRAMMSKAPDINAIKKLVSPKVWAVAESLITPDEKTNEIDAGEIMAAVLVAQAFANPITANTILDRLYGRPKQDNPDGDGITVTLKMPSGSVKQDILDAPIPAVIPPPQPKD
jgi:hypothetical protein